MSESWREFWGRYRRRPVESDADLFVEVGKTIAGAPISDAMLAHMIERIRRQLVLERDDHLFEVCCGNGLITRGVASSVKRVVATDFSEHLIASARAHSVLGNVTYVIADASADPGLPAGFVPTKFLMNDSLGYFDPGALVTVLRRFRGFAPNACARILLTGIPDASRMLFFYDTDERYQRYLDAQSTAPGVNDGMGRWWTREEIAGVCASVGMEVSFEPQPEMLSSFRMDATIVVAKR